MPSPSPQWFWSGSRSCLLPRTPTSREPGRAQIPGRRSRAPQATPLPLCGPQSATSRYTVEASAVGCAPCSCTDTLPRWVKPPLRERPSVAPNGAQTNLQRRSGSRHPPRTPRTPFVRISRIAQPRPTETSALIRGEPLDWALEVGGRQLGGAKFRVLRREPGLHNPTILRADDAVPTLRLVGFADGYDKDGGCRSLRQNAIRFVRLICRRERALRPPQRRRGPAATSFASFNPQTAHSCHAKLVSPSPLDSLHASSPGNGTGPRR